MAKRITLSFVDNIDGDDEQVAQVVRNHLVFLTSALRDLDLQIISVEEVGDDTDWAALHASVHVPREVSDELLPW